MDSTMDSAMDSTKESTIEAKSETIISSDEEKQQVAQVLEDTPQVPEQQNLLERFINLPAAVNFEVIFQSGWETVGATFQFSLLNGGPASMVYGGILACFGASAIAMSLAEMASIDPIVGAQYRWSAHFAPAYPRFWGLLQGWLTVSAWIFTASAVTANLANIVTAIIIFNKDDYVHHAWHTAMLMWLFIIVPLVFNLYFKRLLNTFETIGGITHVVFFIVSIITLTALARRSTNQYVWQTIVNDLSGWTNPGVAWGLGLLTMTVPLVGADGLLHMSAEVKKVRTRAPFSIVFSTVSNAVMEWAFAICILYCIGDIDTVTNSPTGLPLIEVYHLATGSKAAATVFIVAIAVVIFVALFNTFASVSRLTWAFARDHGLPFSRTFAKIHPKFKMPLNALGLISTIAFLLSLIYIGSSTAFNAIIALTGIALHISYLCPILFFMLKKMTGKVKMGPWSMGRWGIPVNLFSLVYLIFVIIWMPFPVGLPVNGSNMNYAGPVFGAILIGALADWAISGRKRFQVPVTQHLPELD